MNVRNTQDDGLLDRLGNPLDEHHPRPCDELVVAAMRRYLGKTLGWREEAVKDRTGCVHDLLLHA